MKDQSEILKKLGITALNPMQKEAYDLIRDNDEVMVLSPTGTGKTLAYLLPVMSLVDRQLREVQVLILVPSRELAIQIEQVAREMGTGLKINSVYGGRAAAKDREDLQHAPSILVGTPGRVADHLRRGTFSTEYIQTLVLDEFDKSLEVGFEKEMKEIIYALNKLKKKVLTSATQKIEIPEFVNIQWPKKITYLGEDSNLLTVKTVISSTADKLDTLLQLIGEIGEGNGIIFCNLKASIEFLSDFLLSKNIGHACFYGGLEQRERERALIRFRNGTHRLLLATDLAARGIDVPELDFIIHYQIPFSEEEFTHRNGRTARMHKNGTAYILKFAEHDLPEYMNAAEVVEVQSDKKPSKSKWGTLFISGGRKDKISKGDIAGLFFKQGGLQKDELGIIELKKDCAFVAVPIDKAYDLIKKLNNTRLKKKKVRISYID